MAELFRQSLVEPSRRQQHQLAARGVYEAECSADRVSDRNRGRENRVEERVRVVFKDESCAELVNEARVAKLDGDLGMLAYDAYRLAGDACVECRSAGRRRTRRRSEIGSGTC